MLMIFDLRLRKETRSRVPSLGCATTVRLRI